MSFDPMRRPSGWLTDAEMLTRYGVSFSQLARFRQENATEDSLLWSPADQLALLTLLYLLQEGATNLKEEHVVQAVRQASREVLSNG
jgi:hypothetical protein